MSIFKLLILLTSITTFAVYGQVDYANDYPANAKTKQDIMAKTWLQYINGNLSPIDFYMTKEKIKEFNLNQIDELSLKLIDESFSSFRMAMPTIVKINNLTEAEAFQYLGKIKPLESTVSNNTQVRFSKVAKAVLVKSEAEIDLAKKFKAITKQEFKDLINDTPDLAFYKNGRYKDTVKLFLICREDRSFPCLFIMKNIFDDLVRKEDGTLWSMPGLAKSKRNKPFYQSSGETPTGVHTMNSVMQYTNRQDAFGKFRRVILNWVPKGVSNTNQFIPKSHHELNWWRRANIGRDAGRKYLRIHGTGRTSKSELSYYPHVPTQGCVSTLEGSYDNKVYKDQRVILDKLMSASEMAPVYSSERQIKGVLYVINIDDKNFKVELEDLAALGIK